MRETHEDGLNEVPNAVWRAEILGLRKLVAEHDVQIEMPRKRMAPESLTGVAGHHYLREGSALGHDPGPNFSTNSTFRANTDVAAVCWPALSHYLLHGKAEGSCVTRETSL